MTEKNKTILLVGGGTGGHIVPILNICHELMGHKEINVITVGGNSAIDQKLYKDLKSHIVLKTGKLHRSITLENVIQFFLLCWGLISSLVIIKKINPELIFSKAGYVSLPIIFWSKILRIPYFIHESDIEMGASNKFAARGAAKIFVGFPVENYIGLAKDKLEYSGQILRSDILNPEDANFDFGFVNKKPIIFITGGSQGARNINKAIFNILEDLLRDYNIIHHTGSLDWKKAIEIRSQLASNLKNSYFTSPLLTKTTNNIDMMKSAILQSDLVISRASATTLSEVSVMRKAIITIPYKYAASDHQTKNAAYYKKKRAAVVISDDNLNGQTLKKQIDYLFSHPEIMKEMGHEAYNLQTLDGLSRITKAIKKFLNSLPLAPELKL